MKPTMQVSMQLKSNAREKTDPMTFHEYHKSKPRTPE